MNFQLVCRLCLESNSLLLPIFEINLTDAEDPIAISRLLQKYFNLPIFDDDGYPQNICASCLHQLRCFYEFKLKCHKAAAQLRNYAPLQTSNCPNAITPPENVATGSTESSATGAPANPSTSLRQLSVDENKIPICLDGLPVIRLSSLLKVVNYFRNMAPTQDNRKKPTDLYKVVLGEKSAKRKKRKMESVIDLCDDELELTPPRIKTTVTVNAAGTLSHNDHNYSNSNQKSLLLNTLNPPNTTSTMYGVDPSTPLKSGPNMYGVQKTGAMLVMEQRVATAQNAGLSATMQSNQTQSNLQRPPYPATTIYPTSPYLTPNRNPGAVTANQIVCGIQNKLVAPVRNPPPTVPLQTIQTANQQTSGVTTRSASINKAATSIQNAIANAAQKNAKALEQLTVLIVQKAPNAITRTCSTAQSATNDDKPASPASPTPNQNDGSDDDDSIDTGNQNDDYTAPNQAVACRTVNRFLRTPEPPTEPPKSANTATENSVLKCPDEKCKRLFCRSNDFVKHLVAEHTKDTECLICNSKGLRNMINHCRTHLPLKHFCEECGKGFRMRLYLRYHVDEAIDDILKCKQCGELFCVKQDYDQHMKKHEIISQGSYVLRMCCAQEFLTKEEYNEHRSKCHYVLSSACNVCPEKFRNMNELIQHMSEAHPDAKDTNEYQCPSCPLKFNIKFAKEHKCEPVDDIVRRRCDICFVVFNNVKRMQMHRKTHFSGLLSCKLCDRTFNNKNKYNMHMACYHSNIRRYRCEICQKSFKYQGNLQTHRNSKIHQEKARAHAANSGTGEANSESAKFTSKETIVQEKLEAELEY